MNWIILIVCIVAIIWLVSHIHTVVIREATAVVFETLGQFATTEIVFKDRGFDTQNQVKKGETKKTVGCSLFITRISATGLVFYLSPFIKRVRYLDRCKDSNFGGSYHIDLGDKALELFLSKAETNEGGNKSIALDIKLVLVARVINPYKWLYVAPKEDIDGEIFKRLESILRPWVRSGNANHAQAFKGDGTAIWAELIDPNKANGQPVFDRIKDEWGLEVAENSILILDIGYPPGYQDSMAAKNTAELEAEADNAATIGRLMAIVAERAGITPRQLKTKIKKDPTLRYKKGIDGGFLEDFNWAEQMVTRDRAGKMGNTDIRIGNLDGTSLKGDMSILGGMAAAFRAGNSPQRPRHQSQNRDRSSDEGSTS